MESTIIVILLASAVVLWKAPFSFYLLALMRTLYRRWRVVIFVILLLALIAAQTHTNSATTPTTGFSGETKCRKS
jgi:hypothetical protein